MTIEDKSLTSLNHEFKMYGNIDIECEWNKIFLTESSRLEDSLCTRNYSTPSERCFSSSNYTVWERRLLLKPGKVNKMMLCYYINQFDKIIERQNKLSQKN